MSEAHREAAVLRRLVAKEDFTGAQQSMARYARLVEADMRSVGEARDLLDWAARNLRAARARLAGQMEKLQAVSRYKFATISPVSTLHTEG